jgi:hypothetical protein
MYLYLVPLMGMFCSFYILLYVWYKNCTVKIVHIIYVRLIDLCWIALFSYYDKCLLQHTHHDRYLLTIISFLITILVLTLYVHFCVVASMSMLTIPISKWSLPLTIHEMYIKSNQIKISERYVVWSCPVHFSDGAPTILAKLMYGLVSQENCQTTTLN